MIHGSRSKIDFQSYNVQIAMLIKTKCTFYVQLD